MGYWNLLKDGYEELVNCIIRPPRAEYDVLELGPPRFTYGGVAFARDDVTITNPRGHKLMCSLWRQEAVSTPAPCVVYLHGNASCRAEALGLLAPVLASGAMLCAFDFSGCGLSDGDYISLGWFERDDVRAVLDWLREGGRASTIALWGRSMGAASSVLQAARDPQIAGLVLDSPFASLEQIALELVSGAPGSPPVEGVPNFPPFLVKSALRLVASSVKSRAGFDLYKLRPVDFAVTCFTPALFGTANADMLVRPHHSEMIYKAYSGDKNLVSFGGDHNEHRPNFFIDSACIFLSNVLNLNDSMQLEVPKDRSGQPLPLLTALEMGGSLRGPGPPRHAPRPHLWAPGGGSHAPNPNELLNVPAEVREQQMLSMAILASLEPQRPTETQPEEAQLPRAQSEDVLARRPFPAAATEPAAAAPETAVAGEAAAAAEGGGGDCEGGAAAGTGKVVGAADEETAGKGARTESSDATEPQPAEDAEAEEDPLLLAAIRLSLAEQAAGGAAAPTESEVVS